MVLAGYYWQFLPNGSISRFDEFLTFDRSMNVLKFSDWGTIYLMDHPDFNKPPLHYWLTALAIQNFSDLEFALRIWPFIEGLLLIISTGLLAYTLNPKKPVVILLAAILASGSKNIWKLSLSAMLDTGDALFFTITLNFLIYAFRSPKYWYLVALSIGLGALQKSPLCLLMTLTMMTLLYVTKRLHDIDMDSLMKDYRFRISIVIAIVSVFIWPAIQIYRHDFNVLESYYLGQIVNRFSPSLIEHKISTIKLLEWIVRPNALCLTLGVLLLPLAPKLLKRHESIIVIAIPILFFIMMKFASGQIFHRYTLLIEPLIYAYLACFLVYYFRNYWLALIAALILVFSIGSSFVEESTINSNQLDIFKPILNEYAKEIKVGDRFALCRFESGVTLVHPVAFKYFAVNHQPFKVLTNIDNSKKFLSGNGPKLVLCSEKDFKQIKNFLKAPLILYSEENNLIFRVE
jgi:4-amino-4-deoxy-L-arabinose transferase-like glycosyltransferase